MSEGTDNAQGADPTIAITEGYRPGLIGQVVALHADMYSRWGGFGSAFEGKVASELAEFVSRLDRDDNAIWHAVRGDQVVGSVAIDGEDLGDRRAHLRWFIVASSCRGQGLGKQLLQHALSFADQRRFSATHLWTLAGLDAARMLYERAGFALTAEFQGDQWGVSIKEQTFVRPLPTGRIL